MAPQEAHTDYGNVTLLQTDKGRRPASLQPHRTNGSKRATPGGNFCLAYPVIAWKCAEQRYLTSRTAPRAPPEAGKALLIAFF